MPLPILKICEPFHVSISAMYLLCFGFFIGIFFLFLIRICNKTPSTGLIYFVSTMEILCDIRL